MSSDCTFLLKRRSAFSRDSPSWMTTSATRIHPRSPLNVELHELGNHQCNRFTPEPAIANVFYRPPDLKSRPKLPKRRITLLCNPLVNISRPCSLGPPSRPANPLRSARLPVLLRPLATLPRYSAHLFHTRFGALALAARYRRRTGTSRSRIRIHASDAQCDSRSCWPVARANVCGR